MKNEKEEKGCIYALFMLGFILGGYLLVAVLVATVFIALVFSMLKILGVID